MAEEAEVNSVSGEEAVAQDPFLQTFASFGEGTQSKITTQSNGTKATVRASWVLPGLLCQARNVNNGCVVKIIAMDASAMDASPYEMNPPPKGEIIDMKASLRSKTVAVAPKDKSGPITLWGPDPDVQRFLFGHTVAVQALEWSPCGNRLASVAAADSKGTKFDFRKQLPFFINAFFPMCVRSGELEAYDSVGEVIVWDLEFLQPKFKYIIELPEGVKWESESLRSICWSPACSHLACGGTNTIYILDAATGAVLSKAGDFDTGTYPTTLLWSPKSKSGDEFLVCGSSGDNKILSGSVEKEFGATTSKHLQIWKLKYNNGHKHFEAIKCTLPDLPQKTVTCIDWATNDNGDLMLAAASPGDSLKVWRQIGDDPCSWKCVTVADNGLEICSLSFLRKEEIAVSSPESKTNVLAVVTSQNTRRFDL